MACYGNMRLFSYLKQILPSLTVQRRQWDFHQNTRSLMAEWRRNGRHNIDGGDHATILYLLLLLLANVDVVTVNPVSVCCCRGRHGPRQTPNKSTSKSLAILTETWPLSVPKTSRQWTNRVQAAGCNEIRPTKRRRLNSQRSNRWVVGTNIPFYVYLSARYAANGQKCTRA